MARRLTGWLRDHRATAVVWLLVAAYVLTFGWMAVRRHQSLGTHALDLGYTDQVVWHTLHGRPFRFTTYLDADFRLDIPIQDFRHPDVLLAYHVEPLLALFSPLYLVYDSPLTLLVLQTVGIALGALPLFWLAGDRLGSRALAVVFALVYLLAPPLEAANLSDFHAVAMSPTLLLFAFWALEKGHRRRFLFFVFLALMAKEEVSLLVIALGLYAAFVRREWRLGAITAATGTVWAYLCFGVIMPFFNGLESSAFLVRYAQFGSSPRAILLNLFQHPGAFVAWLRQPDVVAYGRRLLASGGWVAVFSPLTLVLAAPAVLANAFSSYDWMRSGGGHYSASIMAFLLVSSVYGVDYLSRGIPWVAIRIRQGLETRFLAGESGFSRRRQYLERCFVRSGEGQSRVSSRAVPGVRVGLCAVVLLTAGWNHYRQGISPLASRYRPYVVAPHDRLVGEFIQHIPPDAVLSAQTELYPHVAHRPFAYLFPTVSDADYVFLDVTGSSYPVEYARYASRVYALINAGKFGVLTSDDGYLLLQRGLKGAWNPSDAFYRFAEADAAQVRHPLVADFGEDLRLEGYSLDEQGVVSLGWLPVTLTTYWRARSKVADAYGFAFYFTRADGAITFVYDQPTPTTAWYPTIAWEVGQVMRVELPPLALDGTHAVSVAVIRGGGDAMSVDDRLSPITSPTGAALELRDGETMLTLLTLDDER